MDKEEKIQKLAEEILMNGVTVIEGYFPAFGKIADHAQRHENGQMLIENITGSIRQTVNAFLTREGLTLK